MAIAFQVTFDSADPGAHAAFWAEALHYVQQPPPQGFESWDAALDARGVPGEHRNDRAALGARRLGRLEADGVNGVCIVMQDPEGNEFCLD